MIDKILGSKRQDTKSSKVQEYSLSVNDFGQPAVVLDNDAIAVKLIELLLLKPGTYPTRPNMGVGLVENYRYKFFDDLTDLQIEIQNQIQTYLPEFQSTEVKLSADEDNKELIISITVSEITYALVLDTDTKSLSVL